MNIIPTWTSTMGAARRMSARKEEVGMLEKEEVRSER
jgi:hypothetical protein